MKEEDQLALELELELDDTTLELKRPEPKDLPRIEADAPADGWINERFNKQL